MSGGSRRIVVSQDGGAPGAAPAPVVQEAAPGPAGRVSSRAVQLAIERARAEGEAAGREAAQVEGVEFTLPRGAALCGLVAPDAEPGVVGCLGGGVVAGGLAFAYTVAFIGGVNPGAGITAAALFGLWFVHSAAAIWAASVRAKARAQYWAPVAGQGGAYRWRVQEGGVQVWAERVVRGRREEGWRDVEEFGVVEEGKAVEVRAGVGGWIRDALDRAHDGLEAAVEKAEAEERQR